MNNKKSSDANQSMGKPTPTYYTNPNKLTRREKWGVALICVLVIPIMLRVMWYLVTGL